MTMDILVGKEIVNEDCKLMQKAKASLMLYARSRSQVKKATGKLILMLSDQLLCSSKEVYLNHYQMEKKALYLCNSD